MLWSRAAVGLLSCASSDSDFLFSPIPRFPLLRSVTLGYYTFAPPCGAFKFGGLLPAGDAVVHATVTPLKAVAAVFTGLHFYLFCNRGYASCRSLTPAYVLSPAGAGSGLVSRLRLRLGASR